MALAAAAGVVSGVVGASTSLATVTGQGSTYASLAFTTWTKSAQVEDGLNVNYTPTGSPAGLSAYQQTTADFAGTEAEYSEYYASVGPGITPNARVPRGFAYTPDVAGAIAIMYHVQDRAGRTVNYLHLSPTTIAKIFMGAIRTWTNPTISKDNKGLVLPHEPITLDLRSGQSGTTALFYDWVKHTDPSDFANWAALNCFPQAARVWDVTDGCKSFGNGAGYNSLGSSDLQAQAIASTSGLWSIGYDEFGYAYVYHDNVAWVENASGNWTQPYAKNIAAALTAAVLSPDTSQTLVGVYSNPTPAAYPMSAYSYLLYQCAPTPTRPTCKGSYANPGITNTMARFMRFVACTGQVKMAQIGYSPLPKQLSQFLANAVGYMTGQPAETLTAANCANPQMNGNLGVGATPPPDPTLGVTSEGGGPGGGGGTSGSGSSTGGSSAGTGTSGSQPGQSAAGGNGRSGSGGTGGTGTTAGTGQGGDGAGTGPGDGTATGPTTIGPAAVGTKSAGVQAVGGGSSSWLTTHPVDYPGPASDAAAAPWPLLLLVLVLLVPVAWLVAGPGATRRRKRRPEPTGNGPGRMP
ncbi:MAG TPA: substrate-binding domain-containing protein [Acidimicrobiales bacterium]|nr:substrate-binding domain-containing protein [Acidimicrobiales bacterium]